MCGFCFHKAKNLFVYIRRMYYAFSVDVCRIYILYTMAHERNTGSLGRNFCLCEFVQKWKQMNGWRRRIERDARRGVY